MCVCVRERERKRERERRGRERVGVESSERPMCIEYNNLSALADEGARQDEYTKRLPGVKPFSPSCATPLSRARDPTLGRDP